MADTFVLARRLEVNGEAITSNDAHSIMVLKVLKAKKKHLATE